VSPSIDHLAVAATSLDGRELDDFLGVALPTGGRHARMGTHNRLLRLGPLTYLEPDRDRSRCHDARQTPLVRAGRPGDAGPPRLGSTAGALGRPRRRDRDPALSIDVGPWEPFQRGDLSWQLTVRTDGTLPAGGVVPSLICWAGSAHPAARLPDLGVSLEALELEHPRASEIQRQLDALGLTGRCSPGPVPRLTAHLRTPHGPRTLRSHEPLG